MGPSGGGEPNWGKQSIGNYKGVMLCNRPLEVGAKQVPERQEEVVTDLEQAQFHFYQEWIQRKTQE